MKHSLLTVGVLLAGLAFFAGTLTIAGAAIRQPVTGTVLTVTKETDIRGQESICFPFTIEGTPLSVEKLVVYEGPALEEGTDDPLVDVLALLLHNAGQKDILSAQIQLQGDAVTHHFSGSYIPAGGKVLLLEMNHAPWSSYDYTHCSGTAVPVNEKGLSVDEVSVTETAMGEVTLVNLTQNKLTDICMYHKNFLNGMDVCIGGIAYCTELGSLEPGEERTVSLEHYAAGYSKIVRIEAD